MSVRVACDLCGDVSIESDALTLRQCVDAPARSSYFFRCPTCSRVVVHDCHPKIVQLILGLPDVKVSPWFLPVDLFEQHEGPPISEADVERFLEETQWRPA